MYVSLILFVPPESVVIDNTADNFLKKYTLRELVSATCADDVGIASFADMTVSGFITLPDLLEMQIPSRCLMEQKQNPIMSDVGQFLSVCKLTLKFLKSKYDRAAMTTETLIFASVPPESS